jgi:hypothetical protein
VAITCRRTSRPDDDLETDQLPPMERTASAHMAGISRGDITALRKSLIGGIAQCCQIIVWELLVGIQAHQLESRVLGTR